MMLRLRLLLAALPLFACSVKEPQRTVSGHDYGGLRKPAQFEPEIEKTQPVVPPKAEPDPATDPCVKLCADDKECDRLAAACQQMYQQQGHMNGGACKRKDRVCARVIANKTATDKCEC